MIGSLKHAVHRNEKLPLEFEFLMKRCYCWDEPFFLYLDLYLARRAQNIYGRGLSMENLAFSTKDWDNRIYFIVTILSRGLYEGFLVYFSQKVQVKGTIREKNNCECNLHTGVSHRRSETDRTVQSLQFRIKIELPSQWWRKFMFWLLTPAQKFRI